MSKREELVKAIGDKIIDELFDMQKDYEYEADPEFGGFEASKKANTDFEFGNGKCELYCGVFWPYSKPATFEFEIYGGKGKKEKTYKKLTRLEEAVTEYLDENLDIDDLLSNMVDDLREASMDEYQRNGFASAADFWHWKEGR